ncbi:MAG: hypothetical protein KIS76_01650 [Pyrinomonadaceae bacterium]|nr:hypothetical protein [Pyrinomonadaceae bacterium]
MAQRGFDVFAADIAPIAVSFQTSDDSRLQNLIDQEIDLAIDESGSLHAEIHDFCQPFKHEFFDLIINVNAFQGFDVKTMAKVATTHFNSLKMKRKN